MKSQDTDSSIVLIVMRQSERKQLVVIEQLPVENQVFLDFWGSMTSTMDDVSTEEVRETVDLQGLRAGLSYLLASVLNYSSDYVD